MTPLQTIEEVVNLSDLHTTEFLVGSRGIADDRIAAIAKRKLHINFWLAAKLASRYKFGHLFVQIKQGSLSYFIHGYGFDPETGRPVDSTSSKFKLLRMYLLTEEEHTRSLESAGAKISDIGISSVGKFPQSMASEIFAQMLDVADSINQANIKYVGVSLRPPPNSNACAMTLLRRARLVVDEGDPVAAVRPILNGRLVPGARCTLLAGQEINGPYRLMAANGAIIEQQAALFRSTAAWDLS